MWMYWGFLEKKNEVWIILPSMNNGKYMDFFKNGSPSMSLPVYHP